MAVQSYKELIAWQKAMDLVVAVFAATATFPSEERYGLPVTIKRAAVGVPSRIAEGQGHGQGGDFARYLMLARGLLQEIDTQLILSVRLGFLTPDAYDPLSNQLVKVTKLVNGLLRSIH